MAEAGTYKPIPVAAARAIAAQYEKDVVIVLAYDHEHGLVHTTTYGRSEDDSVKAKRVGKALCEMIGGDLSRTTVYEDFRTAGEEKS